MCVNIACPKLLGHKEQELTLVLKVRQRIAHQSYFDKQANRFDVIYCGARVMCWRLRFYKRSSASELL